MGNIICTSDPVKKYMMVRENNNTSKSHIIVMTFEFNQSDIIERIMNGFGVSVNEELS